MGEIDHVTFCGRPQLPLIIYLPFSPPFWRIALSLERDTITENIGGFDIAPDFTWILVRMMLYHVGYQPSLLSGVSPGPCGTQEET